VVRPRTLLLVASVALLGAVTAVPAPATASEVKLEVNENCVEPNWPCWATPGSSQPALKITVAAGSTVKFVDNATTAATVSWLSAAPMCSGVPASATTNWVGTCEFEQPGTYRFESATLFKELGPYTNIDYTKYEIVVGGTPKAKTTLAGAENQTEAMFNGSVSPEGNSVEYHFEYEGPGVTGKQSTASTSLNVADFASHSVSETVSGLRPGSTYHVELVVTYGASKTLGGPETFTTPSATAPMATTGAASGLHETEATLNGKVDPEGGEEAKYWFEWGVGSSASYEHSTPEVSLPADGAQHPASSALAGLAPGTEYHFRVVARNKIGGPIMGSDLKFKTDSTPPTKEPAKEPTKEPPAKEPSPTPNPAPSPSPAPTSPEPGLAPLVPALVEGSLKLSSPRHGSSVRGSVEVSKSAAGERLEIDLLADSASLAKVPHKRSTSTVVGRLVRASVPAGKVFFSISLNARAKSALHRHHKLALTVQIVLTPVTGAPASMTRSVVLRG
jgi:plastocyanin